jgi:hypothetical protein
MLVDTNELPRERGTWMGKLYALDAAIYRSSPVLLFGLGPIGIRVQDNTVSHVIGQRAVNDSSHPHRPPGVSTNVGRHEPFVLEGTFELLL